MKVSIAESKSYSKHPAVLESEMKQQETAKVNNASIYVHLC